jgi:uncharacterized protein YbaP (TraB family)
MKKLIILLFTLYTGILCAQTQNSLLWKISGNGLEKDSYLFGTMHVSERIAFHLDDVFYESLINSEYVALESNPEKWLDHSFESGELSRNFNVTSSGYNFYNRPFELKAPKLREMSRFLAQEHRLLNGILYRTNPIKQDFQEETYLDMFIFQTGNKFGKIVTGLEDIQRSSDLVKKATKGRVRKESPDLWLQKLMKEKNLESLMSDSYRDRNISLLDSLNKGMYNDRYMENMLYIRNEDMAKGIDSLAQLGSTFSAVGAAHLGGEKGVIQKLIDRGYTVTPLFSEKTEKGKQIKKQIEEKEAEIEYKRRTSSDGFFAVNSTSKLYEIGANEFTVYISPNIQNGAYHTIARINRLNNFGGDINSLQKIDQILFENIPGTIISKKEIMKGGFKGLDIINKTKIGDNQRYQIFLTPLEVIIFKMGGKRDYVLTSGNQFFDSIEFLKTSNEHVLVSSKYKGFQISMPQSHTINNYDKQGNRFIQATDVEGNYYFLKEVVLNDTEYLEEDDFELKRIHDRFYKNRKLEFGEGAFSGSGKNRAYISKSKKSDNDQYVHLKTMIRGGFYYLIGKVETESSTPKVYFDSFQWTPLQYNPNDFEIRKDTSLLYSVNTIVKPKYGYVRKEKDRKEYESYSKKATFQTNTNEEIEVTLEKFHDWKYFVNIDSLWRYEMEEFNKLDLKSLDIETYKLLNSILNTEDFRIENKKAEKDKFGNESLSFYLRDSLSDRAIKVKKVYTQGKVYTLKTLIDKRFEESQFVKEFYKTFQPEIASKDPVNLFENKVHLFVDAMKKGDSIIFKSFTEINFEKEHEQLLIDLFQNQSIPKNQEPIKAYILRELGSIESEKVDQFLEEVYTESFNNPINQLTIFNTVAEKQDKASYQKLLKLLETDVPITNSQSDINSIFQTINDSLVLAKDLYPDLLKYTAIDSYKKPVYSLLAELLENDLIKPKVYRRYVDQMLTEARIEIKKQLSSTIENDKDYLSEIIADSDFSDGNDKSLLPVYVKLLTPYLDRKGVKPLLSKINLIDDVNVKTTYVAELAKAKERIPLKVVQDLVTENEGHYSLFKKLQKVNRLDVLPKAYRTKDSVYKSFILRGEKLSEKDSVTFLGKREFVYKKDIYEAHFFKVKQASKYEYGTAQLKLSYAVFKKEKRKIQTRSAYSDFNATIDETEPIENQLDLYVEKFLLRDRKRVNLSVGRNVGFGYY